MFCMEVSRMDREVVTVIAEMVAGTVFFFALYILLGCL